jgi:hypothetical protein
MTPQPPFRFRDYCDSDRPACLAIFDSNVPTFFKEHERAQFEEFLHQLPCSFFVVEETGGALIGCGGYAPERGRLVWGMVRRDCQRHGAGRFLLLSRLRRGYELHGPAKVMLATSQYSCGFFAREGFTTVQLTLDGWAPGLHRHDMELEVKEETYHEYGLRLARLAASSPHV